MAHRVAVLAGVLAAGCGFDVKPSTSTSGDVTAGDDAPAPPDPDATTSACAAPFVQSAFGCHRFLQPTTDTFAGGRVQCQALGADLLVSPSPEESTYVATMTGVAGTDRVLLGLTLEGGTTWKWIDGAVQISGPWNAGEPMAAEDQAVIYPGGTWAGRTTAEAFILVCEK